MSGISGQLYETKLISLLYFRAVHDEDIESFHLASNIDNIGAFDDICFKVKVKDSDKPIAVFIQAKHKDDETQTLSVDLTTYYDSYIKIRKQFNPTNEDPFFKGTFDETECLFVIYTTAKDDFGENVVESSFSSHLYELLGTGGTAKQADKQEQDVELLCKMVMKEQVMSLAELLAKYIFDEEKFQSMSNELMQVYHVILAQKVLDVSAIIPQQGKDVRHRIATFRQDFFDNNEEYIIVFKDTLYSEVIRRRSTGSGDTQLRGYLAEPVDAEQLSKLIGTVVKYSNGRLEFNLENHTTLSLVSRSTINKAVELAAIEILSRIQFKVPPEFGNKDLTITPNVAKMENRMNHITSKLTDLLEQYKSSKIVTLDESLGVGFLQLNGGLGGAVGNIFVLDDDPKLMKITENQKSLGTLALKLYEKFSNVNHNLLDYKFCVKVNKFPKLSFESNEYEKNLARDFLNKLLFYSSQANEDGVEKYLKSEITSEIEEYQRDQNYFQVQTDAVFLKYHDEIQKWWMTSKQVSYLTRESNLFQKSIKSIFQEPLMSSINVVYLNQIKKFRYTFSEDAVRSLNLQDQHSRTVIIADNSVLTVVKVMQHLQHKDYAVLDLEYIVSLPPNDRNALYAELENTNKEKHLIFVCDKIQKTTKEKKTFENIASAICKKKTIIVASKVSLERLNECFPDLDNTVHDENGSIIDMNEESQKSILENAKVVFQGVEVKLNSIIDQESMAYLKGDVLNKIINEETIEVGKLIIHRNYEEIKHLYVDRRVKKSALTSSSRRKVDKTVKTLKDIRDKVVLITAEPGMGKSTLLTHLSLKTKELEPEVWIVRINLLEYSREFYKWKEEHTDINSLETLKFMCQAILRDKLGNDNNVEIELGEENGVIYLKHCTGDQWVEFELKLFLHLYEKGMMIFLFDGFDEICPHYVNEVIKCIKNVSISRKHRKWITSRSYNEVKTILQREFDSSYEIDYFTYLEMQKYLETFWEHNLRLQEFNSEQLENVKNFIDYILDSSIDRIHQFAKPLHQVYNTAAHYLINEVRFNYIPLWTYTTHFDDNFFFKEQDDLYIFNYHEDNKDGNPLHLYLAALYFEHNIKSVDTNINKWNIEVNAFSFYERFMETKMKTIRFEEKSGVNIFIPDNQMTYENELADFILKHKKLAAYAIFNMQSHLMFSTKDLEEIRETIEFIEKGGEKTGLIYSVANGIPIFIHMTFTEYFAVEYVSDCLKVETDSSRLVLWMKFLLNNMFSLDHLMYVRNIFDYRITIDKPLMTVLENNNELIFNLIMEQGKVYSEIRASGLSSKDERNFWALSDAVDQELQNFNLFFANILKLYVDQSNLNDFLGIVKGSNLLLKTEKRHSDIIIATVLDIVRAIDKTKFTVLLRDNFVFLTDSTISSCVELSGKEILKMVEEHSELQESHSFDLSEYSNCSDMPLEPSCSNMPIVQSYTGIALEPPEYPSEPSPSLEFKSSESYRSSRSSSG